MARNHGHSLVDAAAGLPVGVRKAPVAAGPALWTPNDDVNLLSWFDMTTPSSYNDGTNVWSARWGSKQFVVTSGSGPSVSSTAFGGSQDALVFNGNSDTDMKIQSPGFNEIIFVIVLNVTTMGAGINPIIWSRPTGAGIANLLMFNGGGLRTHYLGTQGTDSADYFGDSWPNGGIVVARAAKAGRVLRWNGTEEAANTSVTSGSDPGVNDDFNLFPYAGSAENVITEVAAIGLFAASGWSNGLAEKIEGFIAHNNIGFGTSVLPLGHTYKSSAPTV